MINFLQTYLTRTNAYVCIFVDDGLGGALNNSQIAKINLLYIQMNYQQLVVWKQLNKDLK